MSGVPYHVEEVCKIGCGALCCRYLMMGPTGFECGKLNSAIRNTIDAQVDDMTAKGDNCGGVADLNKEPKYDA